MNGQLNPTVQVVTKESLKYVGLAGFQQINEQQNPTVQIVTQQ